ncbi:MAG: prolyl oligopeptidase family serine peptidase, partial [Bacteroidales bacterium]|nr:prolyl oligopeptidase family serine peptidase [Bacteroidales bacterium]
VVEVPGERTSIEGICKYGDSMVVHKITNVKSTLDIYHYESGEWKDKSLEIPEGGTVTFIDKTGTDLFFSYEDFITPQTLYHLKGEAEKPVEISSLPGSFSSNDYKTVQYWATSSDGTKIPYSVTKPKNMDDKPKPTLMFAYGGFEISVQPTYVEIIGNSWLERGGVYVVANIRGGGEFGPAWHQAGLKENRQKVYDDFHAVAQDLIDKGITTPSQLGIRGRSNGGLLMGVSFTQRPDLYEAVVCGVPLLDMKRYNKLLAGASWTAEYGNPDNEEEWAYIKEYSPYHNLKEGVDYPEVLFYTSTRDDRVHPGHARKMAAKMKDMGYKVYYYENMEGGHKGSSTNTQLAKQRAMEYTYLWLKLNSGMVIK